MSREEAGFRQVNVAIARWHDVYRNVQDMENRVEALRTETRTIHDRLVEAERELEAARRQKEEHAKNLRQAIATSHCWSAQHPEVPASGPSPDTTLVEPCAVATPSDLDEIDDGRLF